MKTRPARKNTQPSSVTVEATQTPKLETTTPPDLAKPSVMDTIIAQHTSRGSGVKRSDLRSDAKRLALYMTPVPVIAGLIALSYALQSVLLFQVSTILLVVYPVLCLLILIVFPMLRSWFFPTKEYLGDAKEFDQRVRKHTDALKKLHTIGELRSALANLEAYRLGFSERSKSLIGAVENLGLFPAIAAGIGAYIVFVPQISTFMKLNAIPALVEPNIAVLYAYVFFATLYFFTYSRRAAITNTLFNEHCMKQAIAELEAEEKEKEKLEEAAEKNPPA